MKNLGNYIFHIDMNYSAFTVEAIKKILTTAAGEGFTAILWELEDKVKLDSLGSAVHPCALSKNEFSELLEYARTLGLESMPLLQTLGHAEYVLEKPEFFHLRENDTPDCYCTSAPAVRKFLKELINEITELFGTLKRFHLGGDEAYHFAHCPICQARSRGELFREHMDDLTAQLRAKNITPCLWHDLPYRNEEVRNHLSREYEIWIWNYVHTDQWPEIPVLKEAGFDLVIAAASSSYGDSYFLPQWTNHAENIAGAAVQVINEKLNALCVTSWSVRMNMKLAQQPLWQLGKLVYQENHSYSEAAQKVRAQFYGSVDPAAMCCWDARLRSLAGIQWTRYKDGELPPANYIADQFKQDPELPEKLLEYVSAIPADTSECDAAEKEFFALVSAGYQLKKRYLEAVKRVLAGKKSADLQPLKQDFIAYLQIEQPLASAEHNAALVFDPLIEFMEKSL